jgi:hypothetical protein
MLFLGLTAAAAAALATRGVSTPSSMQPTATTATTEQPPRFDTTGGSVTWTLPNYGGKTVTSEYPMEELLAMGVGVEQGNTVWDPLLLASPLNGAHESKLKWYRQAEIKHGRVAMAAFVGWLASANGIVFQDTKITLDGQKFADLLGATPLETWDNVPLAGKLQILFLGLTVEVATEMQKPHYLRGGKLGDVPVPFGWDPLRFMDTFKTPIKGRVGGKTKEQMIAESRASEVKNGRLAMLGIASCYAAQVVPNSVPLAGLLMLTPSGP